ncbi:amino acid permease C-terminal domain-containing protein [Rothia koreensis]|uniref:amino acid permease C-terminal domain-containing protein n=1 Tax=Rothia koreensis TaxID=592378 RepID=UPI003FCD17A2
MMNLPLETWIRFVIWLALGIVVYFLYSRRHSRIGRNSAEDASSENPETAASID